MKTLIFLIVIFLLRDFIPNLIMFIFWKIYDLVDLIRHPKKLHLYGIWLYCGLYGQGKTMALTEYLMRMRKKYGDKIIIATNYGFKGEDFPINSWKDLLVEYDKPVIFGYDEIQNEFNSRDYKNFPYELVKLLTQNRKGNGKQIVGTAQRFTRVDKVIRELCSHVVECRTFAGRWTRLRRYDVDDYEEMKATINVTKKHKVPCHRYSFIQTNKMRDAYDSYQMLETAKSKEYVTAYEKAGLEK